jgi:hypothetical protein
MFQAQQENESKRNVVLVSLTKQELYSNQQWKYNLIKRYDIHPIPNNNPPLPPHPPLFFPFE